MPECLSELLAPTVLERSNYNLRNCQDVIHICQ